MIPMEHSCSQTVQVVPGCSCRTASSSATVGSNRQQYFFSDADEVDGLTMKEEAPGTEQSRGGGGEMTGADGGLGRGARASE